MRTKWIVRRLGPYCSRVELSSMPKQRDETRLLQSMGFETANVHLGTRKATKNIAKDLRARPKLWLHRAAAAHGRRHDTRLGDLAREKNRCQALRFQVLRVRTRCSLLTLLDMLRC